MLGSIQAWRRKRQIRTLTKQLGGPVNSRLYIDLMNLLTEEGEKAKASEVMYLGLHRFPESPELRKRRREQVHLERGDEKKKLHAQLLENPTPALYARLAENSRLNLDVQGMWRVCVAGLQAFPNSPPLLLAQAQAWLEVNNLPVAVKRLEELVAVQPYHYIARKLLGQACLQMGRRGEALRHLAEAQRIAPDDSTLTELAEQARGTVSEAKANPSVTEERGKALRSILGPLAAEPGLRGAFVLDANGLLLACLPGQTVDQAVAATIFMQVRGVLLGGGAVLGIGAFEEAILETENRQLWVLACGDWLLAVMADLHVESAPLLAVVRECAQQAVRMHH
jgi:tetratricopeptide (TPR) repeat protein